MKHNNYKWLINDKGCWLWLGPKSTEGYGRITINGKRTYVHIYHYVQKYGPVPEGLVLDHIVCNIRICCNPDHVKPVTNAKNLHRYQEELTHCPHGHEYTEENTYRHRNQKQCLTCRRLRNGLFFYLDRRKKEQK